MIRVFYGDDRISAKSEILKFLGSDYEIIEAGELTLADLPNIFLGSSLINPTRSILIQDFFANKSIADKLHDFLNTPHRIAILELKLDKRSAVYKSLKNQIDFKEFPISKSPNLNLIFDIYKIAKTNGLKALELLANIKAEEDPMMFFGLLVSQVLKDYDKKQGIKEKRVLKELSKLDLALKSTSYQPWLLIESFLLRLSSL